MIEQTKYPCKRRNNIQCLCSEAVHRSSVCHFNISTGTVRKKSDICLICYAFTVAYHSTYAYYNSLFSLDVVLVLHLGPVLAEQSCENIKNIDLFSII